MLYQTSAIEFLLSLGALNSSHFNLTELTAIRIASRLNPTYIRFEYSQNPDFVHGQTDRWQEGLKDRLLENIRLYLSR